MTDDLIARLRIMANVTDDYGDPYGDAALHRECADALEAQDARIAELEVALKIYAEARCSGMICAFDDGEAASAALGGK